MQHFENWYSAIFSIWSEAMCKLHNVNLNSETEWPIISALGLIRSILNSSQINEHRAVARMLIGGVYIHIFGLCPTNFF